ncbi:MAG: hypothetical protein AAF657_09870 [Acidobacteriota bacterium]
MQGRVSYLLYGVLAIAFGIWLLGQLGGEKRRIQSQLDKLEELLEKDGEESGLEAANRARSVALLFARDFEVVLSGYAEGSTTSPQQISQAMLRYRTAPSRIDVSFSDIEIELGPGERGADMGAVGVAAATTDGHLSRRRFRFAFRWIRDEREWVIQRAELIEELDAGLF